MSEVKKILSKNITSSDMYIYVCMKEERDVSMLLFTDPLSKSDIYSPFHR